MVAMACFGMVTTAGAGQEQPLKISMASFKSGSGWYILAQTVAKIMKGALPPGSQIDVLPFSGGVGNPLLLGQGKAYMALGVPGETGLAIKGEPPYKEKIPQIRMLVGNLDTYWYLFAVRNNLPIKSFEDIKAQKYPLRLVILPKGSSGEWDTRMVLKAYGITLEDIVSWGGKVSYVSFPTAVEMMKDGQADAFGQVATPGHPSWMQLATTTGLRFLPVSKKVVDQFVAKYGFRHDVLPKGAFPGVKEPVPVLGFASCVITTTKMPDDLAYKLTKILCENRDELVLAYKGARVFDPKKAAQVALPLHPGAEKYYREVGIIK